MCRGMTKETLSRKHEMVVTHQIVHTTKSVFLIVELAITRSKMGLETKFFLNDQQNALNKMLCQTQFFTFPT